MRKRRRRTQRSRKRSIRSWSTPDPLPRKKRICRLKAPLTARAANLYAAKLIQWFQNRFQRPTGMPCDVIHGLSATAQITVGPDRSITSFTFSKPSGNSDFDERVKTSLQAEVGQELPPP